ncbi:hypothetical protein K458DRAFT_417642 [Lentithecium fluviatile CBS 122367]|uniref:Uncharacterized protein n=1 Tax=Lentithecium fluviatile CBS 122367 TaxID=1168545 RepID=A0A6G1J3I6_9PLEO|nr:hypothetical protein K458DRAFT_417642 [Lentithecium fluviatile CBS 122367]
MTPRGLRHARRAQVSLHPWSPYLVQLSWALSFPVLLAHGQTGRLSSRCWHEATEVVLWSGLLRLGSRIDGAVPEAASEHLRSERGTRKPSRRRMVVTRMACS